MHALNYDPQPGQQRGIAMVAVLWIVAALSIVVTSMMYSVRHEVRAVSAARQTVEAEALGQGAIQLVLQDLATKPTKTQAITYVDTEFRSTPMRVRIMPLTGLIDINNAPQGLLATLFVQAGQLEPARAAALATAAIEARSQKDGRNRPIGFEAPEDLLRVPGIDYTLYAKISALVTADVQGTGRVSPLAAPEGVLTVLAAGNAARATAIAADRDAGRVGIDTTALNGEFTDGNANTQRFLLQAFVPLSDGPRLLVSRTVDFSGGVNGLHWRTIHASYQFESAPGARK